MSEVPEAEVLDQDQDDETPVGGASAGEAADATADPVADDQVEQSPDTAGDAGAEDEAPLPSVEELIAQRDGHLSDLQRVTAEFSNYRRKAAERQQETVAVAAAGIVEKMLPVLDACEAAVTQGADDVVPIRDALFGTLEKEGLVRLDASGGPFDPNCHEAVVHEPGEGEAVIAEVLRAGYQWNSRVLRPAMVKVRG